MIQQSAPLVGFSVAETIRGTALLGSSRFAHSLSNPMLPEPYDLFDIDRGSDKLFLIGTAWIVLFLFLL